MVQWYEHPHAWGLQIQDASGAWVDAVHSEGLYLTDYLPLPEGTTRFRVANAPGETRHFNLDELTVFGAGDLPPQAQQWQPSADKADLMLVVAHSDDEVLWFGGALPTYAGERGKVCQVCMMVPSMPYRRLELLDCLWTCGVRNYPVWANFRDSFSFSLTKQYRHWNKGRVYETITGWIRRFRPEVLLTHDLQGEYGHGAHRVCGDAAMHCVEYAANESKFPKSAKKYGTWDTPKCYLHLWKENVIDMDWRQPLEAFGGKTSFEVAEDGFRCHISQQTTDYHVEDWGPWDNSLFGLYRTTVGPDEAKNDFFENIAH
jgi:LmbE family N-acetylglucosaminyl deacetylase